MKISVVIPLYNKRETVIRALNSVFCQTSQPEEIIVVNDGSTDSSEKIVAELNHPLVKLINQPNAGVSAARNKGIAEAKGDWIAFLDADDEWDPEYLSAIKSLSEKYPRCSVLATAYFLQSNKGLKQNIILNKLPFTGEDGILTNYFEVASFSHPPLCASAVVVKKQALESTGGFQVGISSGEDLLTWARLAVKNNIAYSLNPLSVFIQDAAHTYYDKPTRIPQNPDIVGYELKIIARQNKKIPGINRYVAHWHKMRASIFLRLGMKKEAFREAIKSLSICPLNIRVYIYVLLLILPASRVSSTFRRLRQT